MTLADVCTERCFKSQCVDMSSQSNNFVQLQKRGAKSVSPCVAHEGAFRSALPPLSVPTSILCRKKNEINVAWRRSVRARARAHTHATHPDCRSPNTEIGAHVDQAIVCLCVFAKLVTGRIHHPPQASRSVTRHTSRSCEKGRVSSNR